MKKALIVALCSTTALLVACNDNSNGEENDTANNNEETEMTETDTDDETDNTDEDDMTAEDVVNEAIALFDDLESLYIEMEGSGDVDFGSEDMDEELDDVEMDLDMNTKEWIFSEGDEMYNRTETEVGVGVESDEESGADEVVSYGFTDYDDPNYMIMYDEGDTEATRVENSMEFDFSTLAHEYEDLLENAELTLVGEEEVNGYQAYHIEAEMDDEVRSYWFDTENFYAVRLEVEAGQDEEGGFSSQDDVIDYELNPSFDESLFQVPDDIEVVDGDAGDTIG
ncbi:hypothetical protein JOC54_004242 [Alkalihalobacillus xiaoxiensis]|uniref:Uncharacterized protein n=1 Tax=Shouchella xiaoxiensis TaxID=766895 RepID=A0ABS2SZJ3_9BACI|nr:hypothetical protein [Shouchella xiaoxiensis]MBM7840948.1 hypothetical protein [Shouchella xiaoxiensis]